MDSSVSSPTAAESAERLDILDEWQADDGSHVVRINGIGSEFRADTREAALDLAVDELDRLLASAEGRAEMRASGLFERYAWVRREYAKHNAHVEAAAPAVAALRSDEFDELLAGDEPFVIDFWATWCQPCKQFAPVFERAAADLRGQVTFFAADLDSEEALGQRLEVLAVPTTIGFRNGAEVFREIGGLPYPELVATIRTALVESPVIEPSTPGDAS